MLLGNIHFESLLCAGLSTKHLPFILHLIFTIEIDTIIAPVLWIRKWAPSHQSKVIKLASERLNVHTGVPMPESEPVTEKQGHPLAGLLVAWPHAFVFFCLERQPGNVTRKINSSHRRVSIKHALCSPGQNVGKRREQSWTDVYFRGFLGQGILTESKSQKDLLGVLSERLVSALNVFYACNVCLALYLVVVWFRIFEPSQRLL